MKGPSPEVLRSGLPGFLVKLTARSFDPLQVLRGPCPNATLSNVLKLLSRVAPGFALNMLGKASAVSLERMKAQAQE
jgi:hypothetical protein